MPKPDSRQLILRLFRQRQDDFVSGAELSQTLGVSRTAIWKHIHALRELGYQIDAVPSRGYRLLAGPDRLLADEIRSRLGDGLMGCEVQCHELLASTNLTAMEAGEGGSPEGLVVIADQQSAGKGRLGRSWSSPPGVNLYLSLLLRPSMPPWEVPRLTFLSAVAAARALEEVTGLLVEVKWPNDLLVGGKKIAGLLNEMSAEFDAVHHVVLGIGLNLNMTTEQFPAELRYPATSVLLETGKPVSRLAVTVALLEHFERLYMAFSNEGMAPIRAAWLELFGMLGRQVRVDAGANSCSGEVIGIDEDGALLLRTSAGRTEKILAGDVVPLG